MLIVTKNTGDELTATEFNQIPSEIEKVISDSGQGPSAADLEQLSKAIYRLSSEGSWYTDSGVADAYVLTSGGGVTDLPGNFDGKLVRFTPGNSNTGASTVDVNGDGATDITDIAGAALIGGEIVAGSETIATFISSTGDYRLLTAAATTSVEVDNAITDSGQTPSAADLFELSKAFSNFSGNGTFYSAANTDNNSYTLSMIGTQKEPTALTDGMEVRFKATVINTSGGLDITFPTLGGPLTVFNYDGTVIPSGQIQVNQQIICYYDSTSVSFKLGFNDSVTALTQQYSLKNLLINPQFLINQRQFTASSSVGDYTVDRWRIAADSTNAISNQLGSNISISTDGEIEQIIENPGLANKTVTLSVIDQTAGTLVGIIEGISTSSGQLALPLTFTFGAGDTGNVSIRLRSTGGTPGIAGAQLEINDHSTDFDYRPEALDLSMCISYYEQLDNNGSVSALGTGFIVNGSSFSIANIAINYTRKRQAPSVSASNSPSLYQIRTSDSASGDATTIAPINITANTCVLRVSTDITATTGQGASLETDTSIATIQIDSEISSFP